MRSCLPVTKIKQPLAIRILTWFAALAPAGMFLSILLAIYGIGPHIMGGDRVTRSEWLHIAAQRLEVLHHGAGGDVFANRVRAKL